MTSTSTRRRRSWRAPALEDDLARLVVGDPLQPARYHAVLDDLTRFVSRGGSDRDPRAQARRLLLHGDGQAVDAMRRAGHVPVRWQIGGARQRTELDAAIDPTVLVAACLRLCPESGSVALQVRGRLQLAVRWPFGIDRAAELCATARHLLASDRAETPTR